MNGDVPPLKTWIWQRDRGRRVDTVVVYPFSFPEIMLVVVTGDAALAMIPSLITSMPWLLALPLLVVLTTPISHVRIDARGTQLVDRWGLIPQRSRTAVLSQPIVARWADSTVLADSMHFVEIAPDMQIHVERPHELAEWLEERRRRLISQEVGHGPYR